MGSKIGGDTQIYTIWEHPRFDQQPAWGQLSAPSGRRNLQDIPRSKADTIDLSWLGESESKSRKGDEAGSEGKGVSHANQK